MAAGDRYQVARDKYFEEFTGAGINERDAKILSNFYGEVLSGKDRLSRSTERSAYGRHSKILRKMGRQFPGFIGPEFAGSAPAFKGQSPARLNQQALASIAGSAEARHGLEARAVMPEIKIRKKKMIEDPELDAGVGAEAFGEISVRPRRRKRAHAHASIDLGGLFSAGGGRL